MDENTEHLCYTCSIKNKRGVIVVDYKTEINGVEILIESDEPNKNRNKLLEYYSKLLMVAKSEEDEAAVSKRNVILNGIVSNMTEDAAKEKIQKASERESAFIHRMMTYHDKIASLSKEEQDVADALEEVIDALDEEEILQQEKEEINGNVFLYEKGSLNISDYQDKLFQIGENTKGNTWSVYVNDEGELVIY